MHVFLMLEMKRGCIEVEPPRYTKHDSLSYLLKQCYSAVKCVLLYYEEKQKSTKISL